MLIRSHRADYLEGGYIPDGKKIDQLIVGEVRENGLCYVDSVKNSFVPSTRHKVFNFVSGLKSAECPFQNLPEQKGAHRMDREKMK